jgi:hypothetical protein
MVEIKFAYTTHFDGAAAAACSSISSAVFFKVASRHAPIQFHVLAPPQFTVVVISAKESQINVNCT